ncbi:protoglobin domain-containing protein [Thermorudis peleae]|uniref:protoglobin domain-containing protein n=1 Tax=Thermorudis peleae TaxID=1382356 RepID=UPI00056DC0FF|nr:protoglobin domain-containing protein [Thermorudis peleae]
MMSQIPGYTYGTTAVPRSPISLEEFELLKKTVLFTDEDIAALRQAHDVLADQVDAILDVWYGFVGANPHLLYYFTRRSDGQPDTTYLDRVRQRFGQWIRDLTAANYNQAWLDYQYEIGLRHHRSKKNQTDHVEAPEHIPLRYVLALTYPIYATIKPFLAKKGHSAEEVERMHQAWLKAVLLSVILWSQPYVRDGDF